MGLLSVCLSMPHIHAWCPQWQNDPMPSTAAAMKTACPCSTEKLAICLGISALWEADVCSDVWKPRPP